MTLMRAAPYPSEIDKVCALCGTYTGSVVQAERICRDMDTDAKTCPHCLRTYGEARIEEGLTDAGAEK